MNPTSHIAQNQPQPQSGHTFSAKEKDDETGYSYFGARYYDSDISVWLSVDPIINPSESPYSYCSLRPIVLIDPTGMSPEEMGGGGGNKRIPTKKTDKPKPPKQRGNSPNHKFNNFLRKIGLGKRIATIPTGHRTTSDWQTIGSGENGRNTFDFDPLGIRGFRLTGIRLNGDELVTTSSLITTGDNVGNGAFGFPIDGFYNELPYPKGNRFKAGMFPFVSGLGYYLMLGGPLSLKGLGAALWIGNTLSMNPIFGNTTDWAVYRGSVGGNGTYNFQIKYSFRTMYTQVDRRNAVQRWFYDTSF